MAKNSAIKAIIAAGITAKSSPMTAKAGKGPKWQPTSPELKEKQRLVEEGVKLAETIIADKAKSKAKAAPKVEATVTDPPPPAPVAAEGSTEEAVKVKGLAKSGNSFLWYPGDKALTVYVTRDETHCLYDERVKWPVDEALAADILSAGVKDDVTVVLYDEKDSERPKDAPKGTVAVVVDGRQRFAAWSAVNEKREKREKLPLPIKVVEGNPVYLMGLMIAGNELRKQSNPVYKARIAKKFLAACHDPVLAASKFAVPVSTLETMMTILDSEKMDPRVLKLIEQKELSLTHALHILKAVKEQQFALAEEAVTNSLSVAEVKARVKGKKKGSASSGESEDSSEDSAETPTVISKKVVKRALAHVLSKMNGNISEAKRYELKGMCLALSWVLTGTDKSGTFKADEEVKVDAALSKAMGKVGVEVEAGATA